MDDLSLLKFKRGKSGSTKTQCQITSGGETLGTVPQKINRLIKARVKRCGKSAPVVWQQITHGKPH